MARSVGISGRVAQAFLNSKLTPLIAVASLAVGVLGILATPREEEPQISVPMIDVISALPACRRRKRRICWPAP
jgi:multidrug efflux pump subunit AcrB